MGEDPTTVEALDALRNCGATIVPAPLVDVRAEALDITRRYWRRDELNGADFGGLLWDWDRFRRRLLLDTAAIDVIVTPATTGPAPAWRESIEADYQWMLPWSLSGAPVVVVPIGAVDGLPTAVQIVGRPWHDHVTLAAGRLVEASRSPS